MSSDSKQHVWSGTADNLAQIAVEHRITEERLEKVRTFLLKGDNKTEAAVIEEAIKIFKRHTEMTRFCLIEHVLNMNKGGKADAKQPESSPAPSCDIIQ